MFGFIRQVLIGLLCFSKTLASIVNTSDHIKCIPLNNQQYMCQPTVISLHPTEYLEGLRDYLFSVNLDRSMEVAILLMIYPINYAFQTKQKI